MLSSRKLVPFLAFSSLLSLGLIAPTTYAGSGNSCLIRSGQSRMQISSTSIDGPTCSALADALSQNGLQFSTAVPGTLEFTPLATLACSLTFVGQGGGAPIKVSISDPGNGGESRTLCQTFQNAGFALDPAVHWAQYCFSGTTSTQAGAIAALLTCGPGGVP